MGESKITKAYKRIADGLESRSVRYDFRNAKGRRKDRGTTVYSTATAYDQTTRHAAIEAARELYRSSSDFRWLVDFYVGNVTGFTFRPCTDDAATNKRLLDFFDEFNNTADIQGQRTYEELAELWATRSLLDGDVLKIRLESGQLETIHSDWIQTPNKPAADELWRDGVLVDAFGRPLAYNISKAVERGKPVERRIDAAHCRLLRYTEKLVDNYRGVSPLTTTLANFQDILELLSFTTSKIKLESLLALAITRQSSQPGLGSLTGSFDIPDGNANTPVSVEDEAALNRTLDTQKPGVQILDLIDNEQVQSIANGTPNSTFSGYYELLLRSSFKALKVPFSFYDESFSNYSSLRIAYLQFLDGIKPTIARNLREVEADLVWAMQLAWLSGRLILPDGVTPTKDLFRLIHKRRRVIDADRDVKAQAAGVKNGFWSLDSACAELGFDLDEVMNANAKAKQQAESLGLDLPLFRGSEEQE